MKKYIEICVFVYKMIQLGQPKAHIPRNGECEK